MCRNSSKHWIHNTTKICTDTAVGKTMIRKMPGRDKFRLYSHKGKVLGVFPSKEKALRREGMINHFNRKKVRGY